METKKKTTKFYTEEASLSNIGEIKRLMTQQAKHHGYHYKGNTATILFSLAGKNPIIKSFLVYTPDKEKALCCAMYSSIWTFDGRKTYLEDICTDSTQRGGGVGKFAVGEVAKRSLENKIESIQGAVANNNTATMVFWYKGNGWPLPKRTYGLTGLFNDSTPIDGPNQYKSREITSPDPIVPAFLHPATSDNHTAVIAVYDKEGEPVALTLANAKFSSGSSKAPGVMVEPVKFLKPLSDEEKKDVLKAAFSRAIYYAKQRGYTDHFYALADKNCLVTNTFISHIGTGERKESADPGSVLVCMNLPIKP